MYKCFQTIMLLVSTCLHAADPLPVIAVSTFPLQWVCQTLVGDRATVIHLTANADMPREWVPDEDEAEMMQQAALVLLQGGGYERWAENLTDPKYFRSSEAVYERFSELRKLGAEDKALYYERCQGRAWLDPLHLELQAEAIRRLLEEQLGFQDLAEPLERVRRELREMGEDIPHAHRLRTGWVLGLNPVFEQTLTRAYGWNIRTAPPGFLQDDDPEDLNWKAFGEFFEFFPARLAIRGQERGEGVAATLQNHLRIHTSSFDFLDKQTDPDKTYPELMRENFTQLTSGFSP